MQTAAPVAARSGRELSEAAHAALRHWAKATDQEADAAARELLGIYREIQQDTRMARSQRESLRMTVRARLDQLCTQIGKRIVKDKAVDKANPAVKSVAVDKNKPGNVVLAQVGLHPGGGAGGPNANDDNGQALVRPDSDRDLSQELGRQRRQLHDFLLAAATCDRRTCHG